MLGILYIGAFQGTRQLGRPLHAADLRRARLDMKQLKWPRPPLVLGFVLGDIIERYMFISVERYGLTWMLRPVVLVLFALAFLGLLRPFLQDIRIHGGTKNC